ncbi:MAG TPA: DUF5715 family protein, partial [Blastocatellia bacterium]|nr:DUF5715 family protein [Blastocatellia bacterium]
MGIRSSNCPQGMARAALALAFAGALLLAACTRQPKDTFVPPPPTVSSPEVNPWKEAAAKVEEDRNEPAGRRAQVQVPPELKHYDDRRRFLAVQVAEWREQQFKLPHDYAELAAMIRKDQLVEVAPLGTDYILYGVGENASDEPFAHYDGSTGENITLYSSLGGFKGEYDQLAISSKQVGDEVARLEKELKQVGKRERERRKALLARVIEKREAATALGKRQKLLASFYKDPARSKLIFDESKQLSELAADFAGKAYDLEDSASRRQFKVRLLSFLRPEARDVLLEIARVYKEKFDRPLPVTSLVRPEQYQRLLSETNSNATRIAAPPHSTGLAFDIYYRYMSAGEQDYLMAEIARRKTAGQLEALRETRDHFHVFVFADGRLPSETLIAQTIGRLGLTRAGMQSDAEPGLKDAGKAKTARTGREASKSKVA